MKYDKRLFQEFHPKRSPVQRFFKVSVPRITWGSGSSRESLWSTEVTFGGSQLRAPGSSPCLTAELAVLENGEICEQQLPQKGCKKRGGN